MPNEGYVCRKCWLKVSIFHEFYNYIESIHASDHPIFPDPESDAGCIADEFKLENRKIENVTEDENDFQVDDHPLTEVPVKIEESPIPKRKAQKMPDESARKKSIKKAPTGSRVFQ